MTEVKRPVGDAGRSQAVLDIDGGSGERYGADRWARLVVELLRAGHPVAFRVSGISMDPTLHDGDRVTLAAIGPRTPRRGDMIAFRRGEQLVLHRVLSVITGANGDVRYLTAGDGLLYADGLQPATAVIGRVVSVQRASRTWNPDAPLRRVQSRTRVFLGLHPSMRAILREARTIAWPQRIRPVRFDGKWGADS